MTRFILAIAITLSWTAPGDDGNLGTAAEYDLRYSTDRATLIEWEPADRIIGLNAPLSAGRPESYVIEDVSSGYFAIKSIDDAGNESGISNVLSVACDTTDMDLNCDGVWDISDLVWYIDKMFRQGSE